MSTWFDIDDWKQMAGTEGTGDYIVVAFIEDVGRIGMRPLTNFNITAQEGTLQRYRIRIEPLSERVAPKLQEAFPKKYWKQPSGQPCNRFSCIRKKGGGAAATLRKAFNALLAIKEDDTVVHVNEEAPNWMVNAINKRLAEYANAA